MSLLDTGGGARPLAELQFVDDVREWFARSMRLALSLTPSTGLSSIPRPRRPISPWGAPLATADYVVVPANAESFAGSWPTPPVRYGAHDRRTHGSVDGWKERMLGCLITRWKPARRQLPLQQIWR